ncbi:MAG: hypothetical protein IKS05_06730, partial [Oscillospiraceae bacterium]|nr:hypothetical protein [Oscillospiraceae bacterium]
MLKYIHLTKLQWLGILKWSLYGLLTLAVLLLQTVLLSQLPVLGAKLAPLPALGIIWLLGRQRFGREHFPLLLEDDPDVADYSLILEEKEIYK